MTISANLHVLCSSADSSVQEIKANGSIPRSKGIHFKLFARTQTILFDLLIRQQTTSITVCDGIRMAGDQMAISAHASLLHALTSPNVHEFEAQLAAWTSIRVIFSRRQNLSITKRIKHYFSLPQKTASTLQNALLDAC